MSKLSTCCTCGYQWPTGSDGSHSCTEQMAKTITALKNPERKCVYCGCTESHACPNGCRWVDVHAHTNTGVCSKCAVVEKFREGIVMLRITCSPRRKPTQKKLGLADLNITKP